jgi:hypothetical protein
MRHSLPRPYTKQFGFYTNYSQIEAALFADTPPQRKTKGNQGKRETVHLSF